MGFQKNNTLRKDGIAGNKKGSKHKKTLLKLALAERLEDFDDMLYDKSREFLLDPENSFEAWKHLSKLRVPVKKDLDIKQKVSIEIEVKEYV